MGTPHTIDICKNCGEKVIQWNNTGSWEHLGGATLDQTHSRNMRTGTKNGIAATACILPHVLAADKVTATLPTTSKTAVRKGQ